MGALHVLIQEVAGGGVEKEFEFWGDVEVKIFI